MTDPNKSPAPVSDPSAAATATADPPAGETPGTSTETLQQIAERRLQGMMDQSITYLENGNVGALSPKVIQLLTTYDRVTARGGADEPTDDESDPYAAFGNKQQKPRGQPSKLEEIGRQAVQEKTMAAIQGEVTNNVLAAEWGEDVKVFMAELGTAPITEADFAAIDFTNRQRFPGNQAGYRAWKKAAADLRVELVRREIAGEKKDAGEESPDAALDADRSKAAGLRRPPTGGQSQGQALLALTDINKAHRDGKLGNKEYLEKLKGLSSTR